MIILDTDAVSILDHDEGSGRAALATWLIAQGDEQICTTIITIEEQMRGWLSYISSSKSLSRQVKGYAELQHLFAAYGLRPALDFDSAAANIFEQLRRNRVRTGTMDLKIAAITLVHDATLVSRNVSDFRGVPGLRVRDWSS